MTSFLVYLRVGAMGEYHVKFLRLTTIIPDLFRHIWILLFEIGLFIYLFCAQAKFVASSQASENEFL